jgi:hypothetical protein
MDKAAFIVHAVRKRRTETKTSSFFVITAVDSVAVSIWTQTTPAVGWAVFARHPELLQ